MAYLNDKIAVRTHTLTSGWESPIGIATDGKPVVAHRVFESATKFGLSMKARKKTVVRRSLESKPLTEGRYEIRVRRTTEEQYENDTSFVDLAVLGDVNEITTEDVRYRNTALAIVKVPLGAKISTLPNVTHISGGKKVRVWDKTTGNWALKVSANCAWIAMDILCNSRYAGNAPLARLVLDQWREWADYCETNKLYFHGVFDTTGNVWDSVMKVFRTGHAQLVRMGTRYGVSIERAEPISMMFSTANIIKETFEESWTSSEERANVIEGTYADAQNDYKERTLRVFDKEAVNTGRPERVAHVDLMGVTSEAQANKDLSFMLFYNRLIRMGCKFDAPIEAIGCRIGDVIAVQHDMPQWGFGGRTGMGSTTTVVQLDREVELTSGKSYAILVHYPALKRYEGTITAVSSIADEMTLTCGGMNGTYENLDRIVVAGVDRRILRTWSSGSTYGVVVETDVAITSGASYEIWGTDVMENRNVVNPAQVGTTARVTQLTLQSALPAAPGQFVNFMFGEVNKQYKLFRLKKIEGDGGYTRTLTCIEYNPTVYTDNPRELTNPSNLTTSVSQAIIDGITEQTYRNGTYFENRVTVHFHSPDRTYGFSKVWYSLNGGGWEPMADGVDQSTIALAKGTTVRFKVLAHNAFGKPAPEKFATISASHVVVGATTGVSPVAGIGVSFTDTGILVKWAEYPDPELWISTTVKVGGTTWENAELVRTAKTTQATMPFKTPGTYTLRFKHRAAQGESVEVTHALVVQSPVQPSIINVSSVGRAVTPRWLTAKTDQRIVSYVVKAGLGTDTQTTATEVANLDGNTLTVTFNSLTTWTKLWVIATDASGAVAVATGTYTCTEVVGVPGQDGKDTLGYVDPSWVASFGGSGDLLFKLNSTTGSNVDGGELYVAGTKFNHPDGTTRTAGLQGSILTNYGEAVSGRFYLMYSQTAVASRFTSLPSANLGSAANLIPVRKVGSNWVAFDNLNNTQTFVPVTTDCLIAAIEAATTNSGLTGLYCYLSGAPGTTGPAGQSAAAVTIYKRSATTPAKPTAATTYTFATGVLTGLDNGWSTSYVAGTTPLWACVASAVSAGATDTIAASEWTAPITLVEDGSDGIDGAPGINTATVFLYQRTSSASAPAVPSATVTYNFSTGVATGLTGGWTQAVPAGTGSYLYITTATAASTSATDTIATGEWAAVRLLAQNGTDGQDGDPGPRGSVNIAVATTGSTWSDSVANAGLTAAGYTYKVWGDIVTLYNDSTNFSQSRYWNGSAWVVVSQYLNGNLFIDGTVGAQAIDSKGLTLKDAAGNVVMSAGLIPGNDAATTFGFNPTFSNWSSTYPAGWSLWDGPAPVKNSGNVMNAPYSVQWNVPTPTDNVGMMRTYTFGAPLPAGTFVQGSFTVNVITDAGGGVPGLLIRLYTNSGLTTFKDTIVATPSTAAGWQRVSFIAGSDKQAIYAMRIYQMASWSSMPGGMMAAGSQVLFGAFTFDVRTPITSTNASVFMNDASIASAHIISLEADKVNAATLSAITATIGTLRTASSGGRTEISDNVIKVFDTANVKRVQIGNLSL